MLATIFKNPALVRVMKSFLTLWSCALLLLSIPAQAQFDTGKGTPILADFNARQLGQSVILDWRVVQGQFCINMQIQRTTDTLGEWTQLGEFGGLCGSDKEDVWYDWFDDSKLTPNTTYFYRIWASNGTVVSEISALFLRETELGRLSVVPNPVSFISKVYFANPTGRKISMHLHDLQGRTLSSTEPIVSSEFRLFRDVLSSGFYLLKIRDGAAGEILACERIYVQ